MALIFKKVKEEEEERWAGQPHLSPGAPMERGPWHLFPHTQRTRNQWGPVNVSQGRRCLGSLVAFSGRGTGSVGQGRAGGPRGWAERGPQHHLPPRAPAGAEETGARLGWMERLLGAVRTGWAQGWPSSDWS